MNRTILLFTLLCFQISVFADIKNTRFDKIYDIHGLNQNTVSSLHQDKSGFIWLGTPNGLFRYDGNEFKSFIHQPQDENTLLNSSVDGIFEDMNEYLWLVTSTGLSLYDLNKETFFNPKAFNDRLLSNEKIKKIEAINKHEVYLLTSLKLYKIKTDEDYNFDVSVVSEVSKSYLTYKSIQLFKGKVYLLDYEKLEVYDAASTDELVKLYEITYESLGSSTFSSLVISEKEDKLLIANRFNYIYEFELNWEKIKLVDTIDVEDYLYNKYQKETSITKLIYDDSGFIWIILANNGIMSLDLKSNKGHHYINTDEKTSISSNIVNDVLYDDSGLYWFATGHGSISVLNPFKKPFHNVSNNYYRKLSLSSNLVNSIYIDKNQKLWIGLYDKGLNISQDKYHLEESEQVDFLNYFYNSRIYSIKEADDKIYLGTSSGLYVTDENHEKFDLVYPKEKDRFKSTYHLEYVEVVGDKLLAYAYGKLTLIDIETHEVSEIHSSIENNYLLDRNTVLEMLYDGENGVYIGTNQGLYHLNLTPNKYVLTKSYEASGQDLSKSRIFVLHQSKNNKNELWIGTFGDGLYRCQMKEGRIINYDLYSQNDGLPDNVIYSVLDGTDQSLWVSTDGGIAKINPDTRDVKIYDVSDGLLANNFRKSAYYKMDDGTILMGNLRGITAFNPLDIKDDLMVPRPQILKLKIRNEEINPFKEYEGNTLLEKPIYKTEAITIPYDLNQITLEFGAIQYNAKKGIRFAYRLLGVDDAWIIADKNQHSANYVRLPSGNYTFELKAFNNDGIESQDVKSLILSS